MIPLTIAQLAHAVGGEVILAAGDSRDSVVDGTVDTDSRLIGRGGLFVAKPGAETDGHLFVDAAIDQGAVAAFVEHVVPTRRAITQIVVPDAVQALADLARDVVARARAAGDLRVVGITGSNGKTTTKNLLARILEGEGETVSPKASFNNEVGAPLTMLRVTPATRFLVSEFGASAPGEIARLAGLVDPDIGVVLLILLVLAMPFLVRELQRRQLTLAARAGDAASAWTIVQDAAIDVGIAVPASESPRAFAQRLVEQHGVSPDDMYTLADAIERASYAPSGGRDYWIGDSATDAAASVRSQLLAGAPVARRILAVIAPRSLIIRPGSVYAGGAPTTR